MDELGSGVLNVNKYIRGYSGSGLPEFIEGSTFRVIIPINEGLKSLLEIVIKNPDIKAKDVPLKLNNRPIKTIERQIKELIQLELVERQGSRKTGGYVVTENFTRKLKMDLRTEDQRN